VTNVRIPVGSCTFDPLEQVQYAEEIQWRLFGTKA